MSTKIHATAAAALADKTLGAKMLTSLEEARKLTGQPATNVNGLPGFYASPMRCVGGVVSGVTMTAAKTD